MAPWPLNANGDVLEQCRFIVFELEGAKFGHRVVDNTHDRGGRTLSGLTWKTYSQDYLRMKSGELCPQAEFDALSLDDVVEVILELFAMRPGIARIVDARLRFAVLDFAVHAGTDDAIPALQRALGVQADGHIGRDTLGALDRHPNPRALWASVLDQRYQKAGREVVKHPAQAAFLDGWLSRFGRVLQLGAVALLLTVGGSSARAQDGGEPATGFPLSSLGSHVPPAVAMVGPVALDILPRVAIAPASVRVRVIVERDADNRLLGVNVEGPAYGRYFEEQLDGLEAARTRQRIYDGLPGGFYTITACVRRVTGRSLCARPESLDVVEPGR